MSTIATPPRSTLSTPSPTERDSHRLGEVDMAGRPIYLIVATALSPSMGIGLKGQLPWPALKSDMAFFRRVTMSTSRKPPLHDQLSRNAVIMGRKTWDSIPAKFRPLKDRINVVITRSSVDSLKTAGGDDVLVVNSFEASLQALSSLGGSLGNVFVIGGSQIYQSAVRMTSGSGDFDRLRILQTQVRRKSGEEIKCDTYFPLDLTKLAHSEATNEWRQASSGELRDWVSREDVPGDGVDWIPDGKGEMEIRVLGWEKVLSS